jgi:hypothetical protein
MKTRRPGRIMAAFYTPALNLDFDAVPCHDVMRLQAALDRAGTEDPEEAVYRSLERWGDRAYLRRATRWER